MSYSRALDGKLAPALQESLQRFAKPWYRRRALRIFRDDASLSANPGLWSSITDGIGDARFFVLLASPQAAASTWVERETAYWLEHKSPDRLLIALTDGRIEWNEKARDFDWTQTTAIPRSLRGSFTEEPRYTDLRWAHKEEHLSLRDPRFRDNTADLAASIRGQAKDEVVGEDIRQHRRTLRLAIGALVLVTILALIASLAAVFAIDQRDTARAQRDLATSRFLAAEAVSGFDTGLPKALLTSLAALRVKDTAEARSALLAGLLHPIPEVRTYVKSGSETPITSVDFNSSGGLLAWGDHGGEIGLSSNGTHWRPVRLVRSGAPVSDVTFAPDGRLLATAQGSRITLWDVKRRKRVRKLNASAINVAFSHDSKKLVSGGGVITIWNIAHREPPKVVGRGTVETAPVAVSRDGTTVAAGSSDGVTLWKVGRQIKRIHLTGFRKSVGSVAFSPDGRMVAAGGFLGQLVVWNTDRLHKPKILPRRGDFVRSVEFSRDGNSLATAGDDGKVRIWDPSTGRQLRVLSGHSGSVTSVAISPNRSILASGATDGSLIVWNLKSEPRLSKRLPGSDSGDLAFSPDGKTVASTSLAGEVVVWDAQHGKRIDSDLEESVTLAFSHDGHALASGGSEGIYIWALTPRRTLRVPVFLPGDDVTALSFSRDGKTIAAAEGLNAKVLLWDLERKKRVEPPLRLGRSVEDVWLSPDGTMTASTRLDGTITLWDLRKRRRLLSRKDHPPGLMDVAFSPDGKTFATSSEGDDRVVVRQVSGGEELETVTTPGESEAAIALGPGNATLITSGGGDTATVWDLPSHRPLGVLNSHRTGAAVGGTISLSPDGTVLATAGIPIVLWDLSLDSWERQACAMSNRNLTRSEWGELAGAGQYQHLCPQLP